MLHQSRCNITSTFYYYTQNNKQNMNDYKHRSKRIQDRDDGNEEKQQKLVNEEEESSEEEKSLVGLANGEEEDTNTDHDVPDIDMVSPFKEIMLVFPKDNFVKKSEVSGDAPFHKFLKTLPPSEVPTTKAFEQSTSRERVEMFGVGDEDVKEKILNKILEELDKRKIWFMVKVKINHDEPRNKEKDRDWSKVRWSFTSTSDSLTIRKQVRKRLMDRILVMKKYTPKKDGVFHDCTVGKHLVDTLQYHKVPWDYEERSTALVPDNDDINTRHGVVSDSLAKFGGNFSCIYALGEPVNLGILHASHRGPSKKDGHMHLGFTSLVQIPDKCMIIFHSNLYHYGARSMFKTYHFLENFRLFFYMCAKGTNFELNEETFTVWEMWCEKDCDLCKEIGTFLEKRLCDENMVWKPKVDVDKLNPGEYIMGDINSLGWVMIKGFEVLGKDLVKLAQDFAYIRGVKKPLDSNSWTIIQGSGPTSKMQFPCLIATEPHAELFKHKQGSRMMFVKKTENPKAMDDYTIVLKLHHHNLDLAADFVSKKTQALRLSMIVWAAMFFPTKVL